jgi:bifunctional enzyme CysN/CysC
MFDQGRSAAVIDGQNMRMGLSRDLGFGHAGRSENVRRAAEVASLFNQAGLVCILAVVAPQKEYRDKAADLIGRDNFLMIHLDAPPEICAKRHQPDGKNPESEDETATRFQPPANADLVLDTNQLLPNECVEKIVRLLSDRGFVS